MFNFVGFWNCWTRFYLQMQKTLSNLVRQPLYILKDSVVTYDHSFSCQKSYLTLESSETFHQIFTNLHIYKTC